jgi:YfiH family protein
MTDTVIQEYRRGRLSRLALDLLEKRGVRHGFTLRYGGVSRGAFASLNFTSRQGDDPKRVRENWRRLEKAAALPSRRWALVSQVHGAAVVRDADGRSACHHRLDCPPADGLVTSRREVTLGILTADCLPVILASADGAAAGIAHAGWKGTLEGVAVRTLESLGGGGAAGTAAGLGPAIGVCCYQVGDEIYEAFREKWGAAFVRKVFKRSGPWRLDLQKANAVQLLEAGLKPENIGVVPLCTCCRKDLFFSHRRDGERTGRMLAFARVSSSGVPGE